MNRHSSADGVQKKFTLLEKKTGTGGFGHSVVPCKMRGGLSLIVPAGYLWEDVAYEPVDPAVARGGGAARAPGTGDHLTP